MDRHQTLSIAHIFLLGPLLIAIGGKWLDFIPRLAISVVGAFITLFHAYRAWTRNWAWINVFHALIVGPALILYGVSDARYIGEFIMMLGFAAIGYHAYYLVRG